MCYTFHSGSAENYKWQPNLNQLWLNFQTTQKPVKLWLLFYVWTFLWTYLTLLSPIIWIYKKYDYTFSQLNLCSNRKMCWHTQTPSLKCKIPYSCIILWFWYHTLHISYCCHTSQCCTRTSQQLHVISITYRLHVLTQIVNILIFSYPVK